MGAADNICRDRDDDEEGSRDVRFDELRQRVGAGEYEIDTWAVADALLRHRAVTDLGAGWNDAPLTDPLGAQPWPCSNPRRPAASPSVNDSPT
jgi:hypothetical protein